MKSAPPFPVIALSTTGLPSPTYRPAIVAIAYGLVAPPRKVGLVVRHVIRQPPEVLRTPQALEAEKIQGWTEEKIDAYGVTEADALETVRGWMRVVGRAVADEGRTMGPWRAYAQPFVMRVMAGSALGPHAWQQAVSGYRLHGRCIMDEASEVMGELGLLPRGHGGGWRYPKLRDAVSWAARQGYPVRRPEQDVRTLAQAAMGVALALGAERKAPVVRLPPGYAPEGVDLDADLDPMGGAPCPS